MYIRSDQTFRLLLTALTILSFFFVVQTFGQVINEELKLIANDGDVVDFFGFSIAIDDGIVAVGARHDGDNGTNSGSAYVYDASTGAQIVKLLANDGAFDDEFGWSIAIRDCVVAVGSPFDDDRGNRSGSAYLFNANTGVQIAKLVPSDGAVEDHFGSSIAIDNGKVAVASPFGIGDSNGSAYLFDATTGEELLILQPLDGVDGDQFGSSIAIAGGIVAVGSRLDDVNGTNSGSAYVFNAATGVQIAKLVPDDGAAGDFFGSAIGISDGVVAVGSLEDDDNGPESGSVYLFNAITGVQINKLLASDGLGDDQFGSALAIDNGIVVIGSKLNDDNGSLSGSAYVFDASTGEQLTKLLPSDGAALDLFGHSVAIDNGIVAAGTPSDDDNGFNSGSAYVFHVDGLGCVADFNGDGTLNFFDVSVFLSAFATEDPIADFTNDGFFNFFDVSAFLAAFAAGCP